MKKKIKIILALVVLLAVLGCAFLGYQAYESNFLTIGDVKYPRDISALDLSGAPLAEWEKLTELTALETLDLRDTGLTTGQHDALAAALPGCDIFWSVPFQGGYLDCETQALDLEALTHQDLEALSCLPRLERLNIASITDLSLIDDIQARYPDLSFSYSLKIGGKHYGHTAEALDISDPVMDELMEKLPYLPQVTTVTLTGTIPGHEDMKALMGAFPEITFVFDFEVFGVETCSTAEFLDLSNIQFADTREIDAIMPLFYNLSKVDMLHCGIPNEEMGALNQRYPGTLFVWMVKLHRKEFRTDITELIPVKHDVWITDVDCPNLCYFTELVALDLGHMHITSCEFLAHMPKLKYLVLADSPLSDFSPLTGHENLIFLEAFLCPIKDYTPFTTLKNLQDLNICFTYANAEVLEEMTWLNNLWFSQPVNRFLSQDQQQSLREALPDTKIRFERGSSTGAGWRELQN